jgi:prepilin-type N-terminal cleavage/methylation domain-containing protein
MKLFIFKLFHRRQAGFTIIEIMVALAITSIIGLGASAATGQLLNQTSRDENITTASRNVTNAIYWISHDALMAQRIDGAGGFPATDDLTLTWTDWDNNTFTASYSIADGVLTRSLDDGVNIASTFIAQNISANEDLTSCSSVNGTVTLTVTSSVGEGARIINITKTKIIASRPKL